MTMFEQLENLLDLERDYLLSGDYERLQNLIEQKSSLTEKLGLKEIEIPVGEKVRILNKAKNNEALLEAAQKGLKSAIAQIKMISEMECQSTYTSDGGLSSITPPKNKVKQRI